MPELVYIGWYRCQKCGCAYPMMAEADFRPETLVGGMHVNGFCSHGPDSECRGQHFDYIGDEAPPERCEPVA